MAEEFELTVEYNNEQFLLPASFFVWGYSHRITVEIFGTPVIFEPDEERNYRAVADPQHSSVLQKHARFIQAVVETLEQTFSR